MPQSRQRAAASALSVLVCLSLLPGPAVADEGGEPPVPPDEPSEPPVLEPPPPNLIPDENLPGYEFEITPPEEGPEPPREEPSLAAQFPDPGIAPSDGVDMLVLGSTTIALTVLGFSAGLVVGLQNQVELEWLLPSTIVPTVGLLAFAGGGLYLGITRARAYRRWEIGYRVIGLPQGGGLMVGGSFALLGALGLIPGGAFLVDTQPELGATLIAVGTASAIATPIMFALGARNKRRYQQTGGWKRRPIPPLPAGATTGRLELRPLIVPLRGGMSVGAGGRF